VIAWALRWVLLCVGIVLLTLGMLDRGKPFLPDRVAQPAPATPAAVAAQGVIPSPPNTIVYTANGQGHVILEATINGAPVRMLVDTGASLVTLTPEDARAAGIDPRSLAYSGRVHTASGVARMAPVTLREVRIDQLSLYDVPAAVIENLKISLLGMSFLSRLQSYEMRDGKLAINW
jgi:aspartyl protease family protein